MCCGGPLEQRATSGWIASLRSVVVGKGNIIDAYGEIQQLGHFGPLGLRLLFKLVAQEVQRFPVLLEGSTTWTQDAVWDRTQSFCAAKGGAVTAGVLAQTVDAGSMARYLRRSVRNFLIAQARDTPIGAVRRKIEDLLAETPDFERVPARVPGAGRWQLVANPQPPYGGDLRPLVTASYAVAGVRAVRWSGTRRAPIARDESLIAILRAVLESAAGSLEISQLTAVMIQRFPAAVEWADAALDDQAFARAIAPAEDGPELVVQFSEQARAVYEQLSPSQRTLLPHLDAPIADQAKTLSVGRSQAYLASGKLKVLLSELVPEDEMRREVTLEVSRLCLVGE